MAIDLLDDTSPCSVLILGLGNLLWADEGFGVRVVERLAHQYTFPSGVRLMDGGTLGLTLLPYVEQCDSLLIVDAIDFGLLPATLSQCHDEAISTYLSAKKMSLHQTGFSEVLALLSLMERGPKQIVLIGVQPVILEDYGGSLSAEVREQLEPACDAVLVQLARWGLVIAECGQNNIADNLHDSALAIEQYEKRRPSEEQACRYGDGRIVWRREE